MSEEFAKWSVYPMPGGGQNLGRKDFIIDEHAYSQRAARPLANKASKRSKVRSAFWGFQRSRMSFMMTPSTVITAIAANITMRESFTTWQPAKWSEFPNSAGWRTAGRQGDAADEAWLRNAPAGIY